MLDHLDAMWFVHALDAFGIEAANRINKAAIESMVPIEIDRFRNKMGLLQTPLNSYPKFVEFFLNTAEVLIPAFMNVEIRIADQQRICWTFTEKGCFACNGISLLGVKDQYECGPLYRIQCWLDYLNIDYEMTPQVVTCIGDAQNRCSGSFQVSLAAR